MHINKHRNKMNIFIMIVLLVLMLLMVSCSGTVTSINEKKMVEKEVMQLDLPMHRVKTLNPLLSTDKDTFAISNLVYDSLFEMDDNFIPTGSLADKYSIDTVNSTVTINLKRNVKWHDETSFDSADVIFTYLAIRAIGEDGQYFSVLENIEGISKSGDYKIKVKFKPNNIDLGCLTFPILPEHKYASINDLKTVDDKFKPVGTGKYKFSSYDNTRKLVLKKNSEYFGEKAMSDISFEVIDDDENLVRLVESSNISCADLTDFDRETKITKKNIEIENYQTPDLVFVGYNFARDIMQKNTLRKAISYLIDRKSILSECYYGSGVIGNMYPLNYLGLDNSKQNINYNVSKAEEILKDAGYEDTNSDGILEYENQTIQLSMLVNSDMKSRVAASEIIKASLANSGISVNVTPVPTDEYLNYLVAGNFDIYIGGISFNQTIDMRKLMSKEGEYNYTSYVNGALDIEMNKLKSGLDIDEQKEELLKINKIIDSDIAYYPICYATSGIVRSPSLNGEIEPNYFDPYKGMEKCKSIYYEEEESDNKTVDTDKSKES